MSTLEQPILRSFVERLEDNPDWHALRDEIEAECARLMQALLAKAPSTPQVEIEGLRGEIRGMLKLIEAPSMAKRVIKERRER